MTGLASKQKTEIIAAQAIGLSVICDQAQALRQVDSIAFEGRITVICGANGSGKSTLLKCLAGLEQPTEGEVHLAGQQLNALSRRTVARQVAVMSQTPEVPIGLSVEELVEQGRYPHRPGWDACRHRTAELSKAPSSASASRTYVRVNSQPSPAVKGSAPGWPWLWRRNRVSSFLMNPRAFSTSDIRPSC